MQISFGQAVGRRNPMFPELFGIAQECGACIVVCRKNSILKIPFANEGKRFVRTRREPVFAYFILKKLKKLPLPSCQENHGMSLERWKGKFFFTGYYLFFFLENLAFCLAQNFSLGAGASRGPRMPFTSIM